MLPDFLPSASPEMLAIRAALLKRLRTFFDGRGFLELETPLVSHDVVVDRHLDPLSVTLFADPRHPYTRGLMASMPAVIALGANDDTRLTEIPGMVPSLTNLPPGCAFAPRCPLAVERCQQEYPPLQDFGGHHRAACWRAAELAEAS